MQQIGVPAVAVIPGVDRAPRWPVGVVGSMTHCAGYRAAAVARSDELFGVGIDAEPHAALPDAVLDLVLRDEERARLPALTDAYPDLHWDRILAAGRRTSASRRRRSPASSRDWTCCSSGPAPPEP